MKRVLIILCLLSFACSPSGTSILSGGSSSSTSGTTDSADIGGPSIGAGSPVNSAEDDLGTDSSSDIPGESNVDGTDLPHGGIAIPRLESSSLVAYAPDSSDYVPVVGSEGTVEDFESGSMLVVSEESLGAELASVEFMSLRATKERGNPGWIQMATTLAPSPWSLAPRSAHAASDICSEGSNHCCEINSNGSFECYYPLESKSVSNLNLAILLPSGEIGESITEPLQSNLKWLKSEPTDVVIADGDVVSVAESLAIKAQADESGDYTVTGDFDDADGGYRHFDVSGERMVYDPFNTQFVSLDTIAGISFYNNNRESGEIGALKGSFTYEKAKSYVKLKREYGESYLAIETDPENEGRLLQANIDASSDFYLDFIKTSDIDEDGELLTHGKTINFSFNSSGYALIAFKDGLGRLRLRVSNGETRFGGISPLAYAGEEPFFSDIRFITDNKALLLDSANKKVWIALINTETERLITNMDDLTKGVSVGLGAKSIIFNNIRTRAYILNEGDETITVINLKNGDREESPFRERPLVSGTIKLSDYVPGKALSFEPKAAVAQDNKIIIASKKTKALLIVDTETFSETDSSEEDLDGDGYIFSTGDCNDNDAALHPATVWYLDADGDGHGDLDNSTVQCEAPGGFNN